MPCCCLLLAGAMRVQWCCIAVVIEWRTVRRVSCQLDVEQDRTRDGWGTGEEGQGEEYVYCKSTVCVL
jgi:hypothetical protein